MSKECIVGMEEGVKLVMQEYLLTIRSSETFYQILKDDKRGMNVMEMLDLLIQIGKAIEEVRRLNAILIDIAS